MLSNQFANQKVSVISVNKRVLTLRLLIQHAHTEQPGANQHPQVAGMSPVSMVVEKKRRRQVF